MNADDELLALLELAHRTVKQADQCHEGIKRSAGGKFYPALRDAYFKARIVYFVSRRPLNVSDLGPHYREGAELQPWNHRIPWNCPTYWDGCNCDDGPFYESPAVGIPLEFNEIPGDWFPTDEVASRVGEETPT